MSGNNPDHRQTVKTILLTKFEISEERFAWDKPLEQLNENFRILGYLMYLEQLLNRAFDIELPLIEHVSSSIHSPQDILELVESELENNT